MGVHPAVTIAVLALFAVLVLIGMRRGWTARARRSAALVPELPAMPSEPGAERTDVLPATYVSTTTSGDWLDRVATLDLGVRSKATVQVLDAGLAIRRTGARDLFVPADALVAVGRAPGMAGKFVGADGLVVVTWLTAGRSLDTGLRTAHARDRDILSSALSALIAPHTAEHEEQQ
ncbi:MAG: PH-like domain-containing protein [Cellulomonadaceae bacterium]